MHCNSVKFLFLLYYTRSVGKLGNFTSLVMILITYKTFLAVKTKLVTGTLNLQMQKKETGMYTGIMNL